MSINQVVIAFSHDACLNVGGVARSDRRFGHREGGANLPLEQGLQPLLLMFRRTVTHQHFHVSGIRRTAVERFGRDRRASHDFA